MGTPWQNRGKSSPKPLQSKHRTQKKVLSLVLCVAMMLSVMVMSTGATSFTDEDKVSDNYAEAVEVLTGMGVIKGDDNNAFRPQDSITRAEVSTLIYRAATADVGNTHPGLTAGAKLFDDVSKDDWFAGYVNYCADAEYVKGYEDNTFRAANDVTGYEVLAMILRAVGYDKNNEFTGLSWTIQVASTATELGMLENLDDSVSLAAPATREVVAELIFRAIEPGVDTVHYSPAAGDYLSDRDGSLGQQKFDLASKPDADVWGRPNVEWYKANTSTVYATIEQDAVYTNNVKVDECDIAEAIGLTKAADIEAAYIDGEKQPLTSSAVTTDRDGDIDPLATTSLVGAQGRQLEIYDMGDAGYRIVEINTYLAVVDKVTASTTDKNGHTTDATVDLAVYLTNSTPDQTNFDKVVATGFEKNDYVLVTITRDDNTVRSIELAPVVAGGKVNATTPAYGTVASTTTVGETKYNDADKFFLKNTNTTDNWNVITDTYNNVIGLAPSIVNYLVIEKIEWKDSVGTVGGGYALADVVLADGTKMADVTVASVNDAALTSTDEAGTVNNHNLSDQYTNNGGTGGYYNHIYSYTVNSDGEYVLTGYCNDVNASSSATSHNTGTVNFTTGKTSTIDNQTNKVVANDNTVFLVKNTTGDEYSYTVYEGVDNLPSMEVAADNLCYLSDGTYATLVVINAYTLDGNEFVAYAGVDSLISTDKDGVHSYAVYKLGSTEPTIVTSSADLFTNDGFYSIKVENDGEVDGTPTWFMGTYDTSNSGTATSDDYIWDRGYVGGTSGNSLVLNNVGGGTYMTDVRTNADTAYFQVTKTTYTDGDASTTDTIVTTIEAASAADVAEGDRVVVASEETTATNEKVASYVYILDAVDTDVSTPVTPDSAVIHYVLKVIESDGTATVYTADRTVTAADTTYSVGYAVDYIETAKGITFATGYNVEGTSEYAFNPDLGEEYTLNFTISYVK